MHEPTRLAKAVAHIARCSRAEAERYVEGGWVRVDGVVVETPQAMVLSQAVEIDPDAQAQAAELATMLLHKPAGAHFETSTALVTAAARSPSDSSDTRVLQRHFGHLSPLMALDAEASGLIVVSQDTRVCRRLMHDGARIEQEFIVEVKGTTDPYTLGRLARGMDYEGRALPACKVSWQNEVRLRFAIKDVRPGQLRHMCRQAGLAVVAIKRIRIGRIPLGKMPAGQWRYLPTGERF